GKVLVGNSGGEFGIHGWLTALDETTGKIAWRAYNTGPDRDVLIGSRFKPFYSQYKGSDLGVKSWPPDAWKIGGAGVWGWISYDPELNLIYFAPQIRARGILKIAPATICGLRAFGRAIPTLGKRFGFIRLRRTICTTTTLS